MTARQPSLFPGLPMMHVPALSRIELELLRVCEIEMMIERRKWRIAPLRRLVKLRLLEPLGNAHYRVTKAGSIAALINAQMTPEYCGRK